MTEKEWLDIGLQNGILKINIETISFADAYKKWFRMKMDTVKPQTLDRYDVTYRKYYFDTNFSNLNLLEINEKAVSIFLNEKIIENGAMTEKEYKRMYGIVYGVLSYCNDMDIGGISPLKWGKIKRYTPTRYIIKPERVEYTVSELDIERLFKCVLQNEIYYEKQSACICLLLNFYLGLRIGELAGLTWSDVDFKNNVVRVHQTAIKSYERDSYGNKISSMQYSVYDDTKTIAGKRVIPLTAPAVSLLQLLRLHHDKMHYDSCYLAYDGKDTIIVRSLDRTLRRLCNLCNVPYFNSHKIRKTFATILHENAVPTKVLADLLGHTSVSTTEKFYIVSNKDSWQNVAACMGTALNFYNCKNEKF